MYKSLVLIFSLFCLNAALFAQTKEVKDEVETIFHINEQGEVIETSEPIFNFNEEIHDFEEIPEGDKHTHEFLFTNIGKSPLIIQGVKASCGCTTPDWPKDPILPGESSMITATYNTKGRPGPFNKGITITSNAVTPTKRLFIKGKVIPGDTEEAVPVKEKSIVDEK